MFTKQKHVLNQSSMKLCNTMKRQLVKHEKQFLVYVHIFITTVTKNNDTRHRSRCWCCVLLGSCLMSREQYFSYIHHKNKFTKRWHQDRFIFVEIYLVLEKKEMQLIRSKRIFTLQWALPNICLQNKLLSPISSGNFITTQQAFFADTNPKHDMSVQYAQITPKKNSNCFCICRVKKVR